MMSHSCQVSVSEMLISPNVLASSNNLIATWSNLIKSLAIKRGKKNPRLVRTREIVAPMPQSCQSNKTWKGNLASM